MICAKSCDSYRMEIPTQNDQEKRAALGPTVLFVIGLLGLGFGLYELTVSPPLAVSAIGVGFLGVCGAFIAAGEQTRR